jgi:uncharacterized protein (DUF983 family)
MTATEMIAQGIHLHCPHCGEKEASIALHLSQVTISCEECEEEITPEDIHAMALAARKWGQLLNWINTMPQEEAE